MWHAQQPAHRSNLVLFPFHWILNHGWHVDSHRYYTHYCISWMIVNSWKTVHCCAHLLAWPLMLLKDRRKTIKTDLYFIATLRKTELEKGSELPKNTIDVLSIGSLLEWVNNIIRDLNLNINHQLIWLQFHLKRRIYLTHFEPEFLDHACSLLFCMRGLYLKRWMGGENLTINKKHKNKNSQCLSG